MGYGKIIPFICKITKKVLKKYVQIHHKTAKIKQENKDNVPLGVWKGN